jgi:hypothetical protein
MFCLWMKKIQSHRYLDFFYQQSKKHICSIHTFWQICLQKKTKHYQVSFASTIPGQYVGSQVMQWFSNIHMYKNILKYSLKSYFHERWLVSINLPFCFALLFMTFAINIETKLFPVSCIFAFFLLTTPFIVPCFLVIFIFCIVPYKWYYCTDPCDRYCL